MRPCYVDTSVLLSIAFWDEGAATLTRELEGYFPILSSDVMNAEFRATLGREGVGMREGLLEVVTWVVPERRLNAEVERVLQAGSTRGDDVWHLACALYVAESPGDLPFLTLDDRQATLAGALGFPTPISV